jgi:hypothetical protein
VLHSHSPISCQLVSGSACNLVLREVDVRLRLPDSLGHVMRPSDTVDASVKVAEIAEVGGSVEDGVDDRSESMS